MGFSLFLALRQTLFGASRQESLFLPCLNLSFPDGVEGLVNASKCSQMNLLLKLPYSPSITERKQKKSSVLSLCHGMKGLNLVMYMSDMLGAPKSRILNAAAERGGSVRLTKAKSLRSKGGNDSLSRVSDSTGEEKAYEFMRKTKLKESLADAQQMARTPESLKAVTLSSKCTEDQMQQDSLIAGSEFKEKYQPVVDYLLSIGVEQSILERIMRRSSTCFYVQIDKVKERLGYLMSLGIKSEDIGKVIKRQPRVLRFNVDGMMTPCVQYLRSIGVPETSLGRAITCCPSLLGFSVERSLKERVRYLVEEVGIKEQDVSKIVQRSPHILTKSITGCLRQQINFLLKEVGLSHKEAAKVVTKCPQLLSYSIRNGIQPRIDFFKSIGLSDPDIAVIFIQAPQVLSLSVEKSLKPKCDYLTMELKCGLKTIVSFPTCLCYSLEQRIQPRHEFLKVLGRLPIGPFPMRLFAVTDQEFCRRYANVDVEEYHTFRGSLHLSKSACQREQAPV